jgi:hypothetical protein
VTFGKFDEEGHSASSSIDSIDEFEIDDSFLDEDYKADRGNGQKMHNTRSTGRDKGKKPKISAQNQSATIDVQGTAKPNYDVRKKEEARHRLLAKKLKGYRKQE